MTASVCVSSLDAEEVDEEDADHPAVESADEEHGDDEARGDVGAGRPARHPVVEEQHRQQRKVVELWKVRAGSE